MSNVIELKALRRMGSSIDQYIHCADCFNELPKNQSPKEYQLIDVGWTELGLQIWCRRHRKNILHLDFDGRRLRAIPTD